MRFVSFVCVVAAGLALGGCTVVADVFGAIERETASMAPISEPGDPAHGARADRPQPQATSTPRQVSPIQVVAAADGAGMGAPRVVLPVAAAGRVRPVAHRLLPVPRWKPSPEERAAPEIVAAHLVPLPRPNPLRWMPEPGEALALLAR